MPDPSWTDEWFRIALLIAWLPAVGFPIVYGFTSPWWKTLIGRALETKAIAMLFLITLTNLFNLLGPDYPGRNTMKVVGSTLLVIGIWGQFIGLLKAKWDQRRDKRDPLIDDDDVRRDV